MTILNELSIELKEICEIKDIHFDNFLTWIKEGISDEEIIIYHIGTTSPIAVPDVLLAVLIVTDKYIHGFDINEEKIVNHGIHKIENFNYFFERIQDNIKHLFFNFKYGYQNSLVLSDTEERYHIFNKFVDDFLNLVWGE